MAPSQSDLTVIVDEVCFLLERESGTPPGAYMRNIIERRLRALVGSGIADPAKLKAFTLIGLQLEAA